MFIVRFFILFLLFSEAVCDPPRTIDILLSDKARFNFFKVLGLSTNHTIMRNHQRRWMLMLNHWPQKSEDFIDALKNINVKGGRDRGLKQEVIALLKRDAVSLLLGELITIYWGLSGLTQKNVSQVAKKRPLPDTASDLDLHILSEEWEESRPDHFYTNDDMPWVDFGIDENGTDSIDVAFKNCEGLNNILKGR